MSYKRRSPKFVEKLSKKDMSELNLMWLTERWAQDGGGQWGLKWDMVEIKEGYHAKTKT